VLLKQGKEPVFKMLARRLTTQGIEQFEAYLSSLRTDATLDAPMELLTGSATSAPLDTEVDATPRELHSRLEVAEHLNRILKIDSGTLRTDSGFWSWLALSWFESLCPSRNGRWLPGDRNRWIADLEDPRKACRHILAGPFQVYRAHRDDPTRALVLLCGAPEQLGPLVTLIASRPSLVTCKAVVGAATRLYYDSAKGRNRSGLSGKGPGSPRRFADILSQLDLTWDLHSLSTEDLLDLLPSEFDEFRRQKGSSRQRPLIE
jgi:hypothetical protein